MEFRGRIKSGVSVMRIAVMGAGGVGGCLGALLTQAGADITLITRGEHLRAMQEHGLRLNQQTGSFTIPVNATDDPSQVGPVETWSSSPSRPIRSPKRSRPYGP